MSIVVLVFIDMMEIFGIYDKWKKGANRVGGENCGRLTSAVRISAPVNHTPKIDFRDPSGRHLKKPAALHIIRTTSPQTECCG